MGYILLYIDNVFFGTFGPERNSLELTSRELPVEVSEVDKASKDSQTQSVVHGGRSIQLEGKVGLVHGEGDNTT